MAWDWWDDWNLYNVDFRSDINNSTYTYYIDFAAQHSIEYVILDEDWTETGAANMMKVILDINLKELIGYRRTKDVDIILWAEYYASDRNMEKTVKHYADMEVKGFKIYFMDHDDQEMVWSN